MKYEYKLKVRIKSDSPIIDSIIRKKILDNLADLGEVIVDQVVKQNSTPNYLQTLGTFSPDDVLPFTNCKEKKKTFVVGDKSYNVRMTSQRYFIFKASRHCVSCGIEGTKMLLQKNKNDTLAHFNLYAEENGQLVLMTKDHIFAKSQGGEDRHTNYQTMCFICNNLKGSDFLAVEDIGKLRKIYNENIDILTRKKLYQLIAATKKKLKKPDRRPEAKKVGLFAKSDMNILKTAEGLVGVQIATTLPDSICIACVPKGTEFYNAEKIDNKYLIPLNNLKGVGDDPRVKFSVFSGLIECFKI
jgi:hypothetical protein